MESLNGERYIFKYSECYCVAVCRRERVGCCWLVAGVASSLAIETREKPQIPRDKMSLSE